MSRTLSDQPWAVFALRALAAVVAAGVGLVGGHTVWYAVPKWLKRSTDFGEVMPFSYQFYNSTNMKISMVVSPLVAALAAWLAWVVIGRAAARHRARRRVAAGLCAACGYDLRGSMRGGRCPECGTAPAAAS